MSNNSTTISLKPSNDEQQLAKQRRQNDESQKSNLNVHHDDSIGSNQLNRKSVLVTHAEERKHKCSICGKAFKQSSHLNQHMVTHTEERNFKVDREECG